MVVPAPARAGTLAPDPYGPVPLSSDIVSPVRYLNPNSHLPRHQALRPRQETSCAPISEAEVRALPGWQVIADISTRNWGADWDRTLTNPPEYPDKPAFGCVNGDTQTISLDGEPFCSHATSEASPTDPGRGAVSVMQGTRSVAHLVVNRAAAFPQSLFLTGPLTIPSLSADMHALPAVLTIDNTLGSTVTLDNEDTVPRNISMSAGPRCTMRLKNTTCTAIGTARIRVEARGWIWFNYGSLRNGHFKWALSLDALIQDADQRASYADLGATLVSSGVTAQGCTVSDRPIDPAASPEKPAAPAKHGLAAYAIFLVVLFAVLVVVSMCYFFWRKIRQRAARSTTAVVRPGDTLAAPVRVRAHIPHCMPLPAAFDADEKYRAWLTQLDRRAIREHIPPC